jgi:Flp pilus assembly protein CpaB
LKRSNRLVLLIGVFLAILAFVAIIFIIPRDGGGTPPPPTTQATVIATQDIPLGARIQADQVTIEQKPIDGRDTDAFGDVSQVVGQKVRQPVVTGQAITARTLSGGTTGQIIDIEVPPTKRAITVQVDQVTGVGTTIKPGDYVDMVVGIRADKFPVITTNPADNSFTVVAGINGTSVKLLLQGMQVLGTLLPPPPQNTSGQEGQPPPSGQPGTALNGQQEIVALAVDAQQAEVIKFAQLDGDISLILRSTQDFLDPATGQPIDPPPLPDATTGVILKTLVDRYGVLPPELIETVLPAQARR